MAGAKGVVLCIFVFGMGLKSAEGDEVQRELRLPDCGWEIPACRARTCNGM